MNKQAVILIVGLLIFSDCAGAASKTLSSNATDNKSLPPPPTPIPLKPITGTWHSADSVINHGEPKPSPQTMTITIAGGKYVADFTDDQNANYEFSAFPIPEKHYYYFQEVRQRDDTDQYHPIPVSCTMTYTGILTYDTWHGIAYALHTRVTGVNGKCPSGLGPHDREDRLWLLQH